MDVTAKHIGSFFIVSFPEKIPDDETLYFLQDKRIGGIILFADHCCDKDSLKSWLADFTKTLGRPLIIAVDQEGGRVRRFMRGFPRLESPRYYGSRRRLTLYRSDLSRVCERLFEIGINLNLVPVVDLFDTEKGHVLDTRAFSAKRDVVSRFARLTIDVHRQQGLLTCAKHFPGLGRSEGDPHFILSTADLDENDFNETELPPFKDVIEYGVDAVMVTHLAVPKVDSHPAVVSNKIIGGWLKERLAFSGPVITDDLLMTGAADIDSTPDLAARSFEAGADLLLFGQNLKDTRCAFDVFNEVWDAGRFAPGRIADAEKRLEQLLRKLVP